MLIFSAKFEIYFKSLLKYVYQNVFTLILTKCQNYMNKLRVGVELHDDEEVIAALIKQKEERKKDKIVIIE